MKVTSSYLILIFLVGLIANLAKSQEAPKPRVIKNTKIGKWVNIHSKRTDLLGVKVQQFPDNKFSAANYEGQHPAMVIYIFKNLKAHQIEFNPDGSIRSGFWWKVSHKHPILTQMTKL